MQQAALTFSSCVGGRAVAKLAPSNGTTQKLAMKSRSTYQVGWL